MKKMSLSTKVLIGFVLGIIIALIFKEKATVVKPLGDLFLNLIKMIVVPLVFFSIVSGITSMNNFTKLKRIGGKVLLFYIATTICAGTIGLLVANLISPGSSVTLDEIEVKPGQFEEEATPSVVDTIVSMFPTNPFNSLVEGNLMQVIVFSIFLGISMVLLGDKVQTFKKFFDNGAEVMYKITDIVMKFSPIGVAALIATTIGEYGAKVLGSITALIIADYVGLLLICFGLYALIIKFFVKMKLGTFYKSALKIWPITASTTSSSGTLPYTMEVVERDLGVSKSLTGFSLPLGATINMDGAVNYFAIAVIFVAQIYGIELTITQQITTILLATLISVGAPGIPGGGIVMTIMLLTTMGLPLEIMGLIAGIYRVIDMGHTSLNVTGDMVCTLAVAKSENLISDTKPGENSEDINAKVV
ncbi:dicarboxylate/amino acid:cation symporter [Virgibacillus necropolis]|uniref:Sodium:dicarboxylate symporter n=1 Tax=Virgibacillus necropolis TaxID=163877 RepID=A0A221M9F2_9BACI|nr:dicarboxylate/amino acid:cation symporter [Virgibacillus necropolis]ASN04278.1 sodium:dicarboxylate symporter [Virgibacillus necropolis]